MMTITRMHIRAMDLNLLPVLAALFEAKSVSRAAQLLNLTQPAVSRALTDPEAEVQNVLPVKSGRLRYSTLLPEQVLPG